jgi:FlaA1/EpsC-like NDP-sugar epimerase
MPVSVYGASKYICEQMVLDAAKKNGLTTCKTNGQAGTHFVVLRFGNVLGSRGSIVPLFQQQIEKGGPVTVTPPDARRYFMTISEACSLVLKAGGVGENGGLYLLDMGEPVRIRDLAEQLIRFQGFEPETEIKIEYVGLRPGERLDETLTADDEQQVPTEYDRILRVTKKTETNFDTGKLLAELRPICSYDPSNAKAYRDPDLLHTILSRNLAIK